MHSKIPGLHEGQGLHMKGPGNSLEEPLNRMLTSTKDWLSLPRPGHTDLSLLRHKQTKSLLLPSLLPYLSQLKYD
jgi:hypothetical protein